VPTNTDIKSTGIKYDPLGLIEEKGTYDPLGILPKPYVEHDRGFMGDVASRAARSGVQIMKGIGGAMQLTDLDPSKETNIVAKAGKNVTDFYSGLAEKHDIFKPDIAEARGDEGVLKRGFGGAVESVGPSLLPLAAALAGAKAGALVGAPAGPPGVAIGTVVGGIVGGMGTLFATFGMGQYQQSYDEAIKELSKNGMPPAEREAKARKYALVSATAEAGGELVGDLAAMTFFGVFGGQAAKQPLKLTIKQLMGGGAKGFGKAIAKTVPFEVGSEMGTAYTQAKAAQEAGISGMEPGEAMAEAVLPAVFLSVMFGGAIHTAQVSEAQRLYKELNSKDPEVRAKAALDVGNRIKDKTDRAAWLTIAGNYIDNKKDIPLSKPIVDFAVQKKDAEAELAGIGELRNALAKGEITREQAEQLFNEAEGELKDQIGAVLQNTPNVPDIETVDELPSTTEMPGLERAYAAKPTKPVKSARADLDVSSPNLPKTPEQEALLKAQALYAQAEAEEARKAQVKKKEKERKSKIKKDFESQPKTVQQEINPDQVEYETKLIEDMLKNGEITQEVADKRIALLTSPEIEDQRKKKEANRPTIRRDLQNRAVEAGRKLTEARRWGLKLDPKQKAELEATIKEYDDSLIEPKTELKRVGVWVEPTEGAQTQPAKPYAGPPIPAFKTTNEAMAFGKKATPEQIDRLKALMVENRDEFIKLKEAGKLQEAMNVATLGQYYREAVEASEGTLSVQRDKSLLKEKPKEKNINGIIVEDKPLTKKEKALKEYRDYVAGLSTEQREQVSDLIEKEPASPSTALFKIQKALEKPKIEEGITVEQGDKPIVRGKIKPEKAPTFEYGVEYIDAYTDEGAVAKEKFHKDAISYLRKLGKALGGVSLYPKKKTGVSSNKAGIAGSGEIYGKWKLSNGKEIVVELTSGVGIPTIPATKSGVVMRFDVDNGPNQWVNPSLTVDDLVAQINKAAGLEPESAGAAKKRGVHAKQVTASDLYKLTSDKKGVLKSHGVKLYNRVRDARAALDVIGPRYANEKIPEYLKRIREYQKENPVTEPETPTEPWRLTQRQFMDDNAINGVTNDRDRQRHKNLVQIALNEGENVPAHVLKDYPELQEKPKTEDKDRWSEEYYSETAIRLYSAGGDIVGDMISQYGHVLPVGTSSGKVFANAIKDNYSLKDPNNKFFYNTALRVKSDVSFSKKPNGEIARVKEKTKTAEKPKPEKPKDKYITPEQAKEVERTAKKGLKTAEELGDRQKLILTGGPPGAGKTSAASQDTEVNNSYSLSADDIKEQTGNAKGDQAVKSHKETSRLAKKLTSSAISEGYHTVYDALLANYGYVKPLIEKVLNNGGDVHIAFSNIDAVTSQVRSKFRNVLGITERIIPIKASAKGYNYSLPTFLKLFEDYKNNPNVSFKIVDNNVDGRKPIEIFEKNDNELVIQDQNLFDKIMNLPYIKVEEGGIRYVRKEKVSEEEVESRSQEVEERLQRILQAKQKEHQQRPEESPQDLAPRLAKDLESATETEIDSVLDDVFGAKDLAKKAGIESVKGVQEAVKGLSALFSPKNTLTSGPVFNEDTYAQAKPHFESALQHAIEAGHTLKKLVKHLYDTFGEQIRPYLERFLKDKAKGGTNELSNKDEIPSDARLPGNREDVEGEPGTTEPGDQQPSGPDIGVREGTEGEGPELGGTGGISDELPGTTGRTGRKKPGRKPVQPDNDLGRDTELAPEDRNHVIGPKDVIAPPGRVGKINANIKAIRLLKKLEKENRNPKPAEKKVLAQYVGWGAFSQEVFNNEFSTVAETGQEPYNWRWDEKARKKYKVWKTKYGKKLHPALGGLLTKEEWESGRASTVNAHFTSKEVVSSMWRLAERLGFKGGTVLEPAAGVGNFFGLMPQDIAAKSALFGVEKDTISGGILKKLYPQAAVEVKPFEKSKSVLDNSIDLTITNVPFGRISITDKRHPDYDRWKIHNYFLARSLDATKPGGLVLAISSAWTMDAKSNGNVREYLANKADLIGAMRLPNTAFKGNAGTEVVTDVLVFRKKDSNKVAVGKDFRVVNYLETPKFKKTEKDLNAVIARIEKLQAGRPKKNGKVVNTEAYKRSYKALKEQKEDLMKAYRSSYAVNEYFIKNPDMVLGKHAMTGTMYASDSYTVASSGILTEQMAKAVESFPENIAGEGSDISKMEKVELAGTDAKEGTITLRNGKIKLIENGRIVAPYYVGTQGQKIAVKPAQMKRLKSYIELRDLTNEAITAMNDEATTDEQVADYQNRMNKAYDAYVKKFGTFNGTVGNSFINKLDNDFALVDALEIQVGEGKDTTWEKAPIFTQRTVFPFIEPDSAESVEDALNISIIYRGEVDIAYLSDLLGEPDTLSIKKQIVDKGLGFINPDTGKVEQRDLYLSGQVKKKLIRAKAQGKDFQANIDALEAIQPEDLDIEFISFHLGSTWVPPGAVKAFLKEVIEVDAEVEYVEKAGTSRWHIGIKSGERGIKNQKTYSSRGKTAVDLIDNALNLKNPTIPAYDEKGRKSGTDKEASKEARMKLNEISDEFVAWAKSHKEWAEKVAAKYNEEKNGVVLRKHTTPNIDIYPNQAPVDPKGRPMRLTAEQKTAVSRAVQESVLLAYGVGTGKTRILITAAMEMKRIGTARKPVIVVHNSTVDQYRNVSKKLYPGKRFLIPDDKQRNAKQRKKLLTSMATGDWDTIILPQSFFDGIANDPARERAFVDEQIAQIEEAILEAQEEADNPWTVKDLENLKENRIQRLERLLDRRQDEVLTFEQMGIDAILVDEVHAYKRSEFYTKLNQVKGIDNGSSQRSTSLILKSEFVRQKTGGKNIITATGTPISNTLAELWTMLRYVRPDLLEEYGVSQFDAFASTFGVIDEDTEQTASGFKDVERFKKYTNGPELLSMFFSGADVKLTKDANLKLPKIRNGKPTVIVTEKSPDLTAYIKDIIDRWKAWENLTGLEKRKNRHVPIVLYGLAKKASVDLRLVDPEYYQDDPNSKVNKCAKEAKRIYDEYDHIKGTQIIFADLIRDNAKNPKFDYHEDIKAKLVKAGIPEKEIVIFSSGFPETKDAAIKKKFKSGGYRVIIGTTDRLGIGVNIADLVVAGHDLTVPDRPMDIEQRHGRFVRQSNKNAEVEILQYATKDTLDAVMFQRLAIKQKGADQVLTGKIDGRDFDDPYSIEQASFDEFAAAASGKAGKLLFEKSRLKSQHTKYQIAEQAHFRRVGNARRKLKEIPEQIESKERNLKKANEFKAYIEEAFPGGKLDTLTLDGETMPRKEAYEILSERMEAQVQEWEDEYIGKPMGDFKKNAPQQGIWGPKLQAQYSVFADELEIKFAITGQTNYDREAKPSEKLGWKQVRKDRFNLSSEEDNLVPEKIGSFPVIMKWNGEQVGYRNHATRKGFAPDVTRSVNVVIENAKTAPGEIQKGIDTLQAEAKEYEEISKETFKYRKEAIDVLNKINDIDVQLKALTSDEILGMDKDENAPTIKDWLAGYEPETQAYGPMDESPEVFLNEQVYEAKGHRGIINTLSNETGSSQMGTDIYNFAVGLRNKGVNSFGRFRREMQKRFKDVWAKIRAHMKALWENLILSTRKISVGGITPERVAETFKAKGFNSVKIDDETVGLNLSGRRNGRLLFVRVLDQVVDSDDTAIEVGYGRKAKSGEVVAGSYLFDEKFDTILLKRNLADPFTLEHELFHHMKKAGLFNPAEEKILARKGNEEAQARWLEGQLRTRKNQRGLVGKMVQKVRDFIDALANVFVRTERGIVRAAESGEILMRKKGSPDGTITTDKTPKLSTRQTGQSELFNRFLISPLSLW
jgi:N12 class adenine-specific DNA methylase/predicted RNA methylase